MTGSVFDNWPGRINPSVVSHSLAVYNIPTRAGLARQPAEWRRRHYTTPAGAGSARQSAEWLRGHYTTPAGAGSARQPAGWRRGHFITKSAPARLGYCQAAFIDVLGRDTTSHQRQPPSSSPLARPGLPSPMLVMEDILICTEKHRKSTSEKYRRQVLEQVQRAVRHEPLSSPIECQPTTGLLVPRETMSMATVSKATTDTWTQTEHMMCHLPLTIDRSTAQQPNTGLDLTQHNGSAPQAVPGHISPSVAPKCRALFAKQCQSAHKPEDTAVTPEDFSHRLSHLSLHEEHKNASTDTAVIVSSSNVDERATKCLTQQTKHHTDNTLYQADSSDRVTQTGAENPDSGDNLTVTRNKKHVSFSWVYPEKCPADSRYLPFQGQPSSSLFFVNLQHMQWKIATGQVDRKIYRNRSKQVPVRVRSLVSAGTPFI